MSANVGVMEGVAGGFGVNGQGVCSMLVLPLLNHRVDCVNEAVLGH